jgi:hypothetical protein
MNMSDPSTLVTPEENKRTGPPLPPKTAFSCFLSAERRNTTNFDLEIEPIAILSQKKREIFGKKKLKEIKSGTRNRNYITTDGTYPEEEPKRIQEHQKDRKLFASCDLV